MVEEVNVKPQAVVYSERRKEVSAVSLGNAS